ncbi:hypothetical protein [Streptococcus suis]|uniref:hypothetical protein n=1 Tax=Streptococcus suis TaxID=1307 RepID=UPI00042091BC|nr:hypothetical protein [Streptococcus suis]
MANYNKVKQFENTGILISDWITNKETLKNFDSERFCLAYYSETFRGETKYYYKIVPKDWLSDNTFKLVSELPTPIRQGTIYGLISKHYNQQKEENTMTVTLFNKSFANATDALIAAIEHFDLDDAQEIGLPGLAVALNAYYKGLLDNKSIFKQLAKILLDQEIDTLTDDTIYRTAWELADYSNFDSVQHALEIN